MKTEWLLYKKDSIGTIVFHLFTGQVLGMFLHEIAHYIAAKLLGINVKRVIIDVFYGCVTWQVPNTRPQTSIDVLFVGSAPLLLFFPALLFVLYVIYLLLNTNDIVSIIILSYILYFSLTVTKNLRLSKTDIANINAVFD